MTMPEKQEVKRLMETHQHQNNIHKIRCNTHIGCFQIQYNLSISPLFAKQNCSTIYSGTIISDQFICTITQKYITSRQECT